MVRQSAHQPPLVVHVLHSFGTGGLENGLVNLINRTPPERYRHAILCLTESGAFEERLERPVPVVALHARPGHSFAEYAKIRRALVAWRPAIVHTRNLSALEAQIPARLVPGVRRVHGVHGRDVFDLEGRNRKYNLLRRAIRPLVQRYTAVSRDLARWLVETIGVAPHKVVQIYNGVDQERFTPHGDDARGELPAGFLPPDALVIGTVGRLAAVKDQATLIRAFARLGDQVPEQTAGRLRLVLVGDGPERANLETLVGELGLNDRVWLAGDQQAVPAWLRTLDIFVLPSLGEGISNTILEAMATGLPVVATRVGGNPELVTPGESGLLVPPGDSESLAGALAQLVADPDLRQSMGEAGLARVRRDFHWENTVARYLEVYDGLLGRTAQALAS